MASRGNVPVRERLTRMEDAMATLKQDFDEFRDWQHKRAGEDDAFRNEMRRAFNGQGVEPGIFIRIDRLEQAETRRTRHYWIVFATAVAALSTALLNVFHGGGP